MNKDRLIIECFNDLEYESKYLNESSMIKKSELKVISDIKKLGFNNDLLYSEIQGEMKIVANILKTRQIKNLPVIFQIISKKFSSLLSFKIDDVTSNLEKYGISPKFIKVTKDVIMAIAILVPAVIICNMIFALLQGVVPILPLLLLSELLINPLVINAAKFISIKIENGEMFLITYNIYKLISMRKAIMSALKIFNAKSITTIFDYITMIKSVAILTKLTSNVLKYIKKNKSITEDTKNVLSTVSGGFINGIGLGLEKYKERGIQFSIPAMI